MGLFYIFFACLCWALDTLFRYPLVMQGHSAFGLVFIEHLFLSVIFVTFIAMNWRRVFAMSLADFFSFLIVGGVGSAFATIAFSKAFTFMDPSLVILLQKLQPFVVIVLARFVLGEPIHKQFILWALICILGALCVGSSDIIFNLIHGDISSITGILNNSIVAYGLVMIAVVGWASATVFGKKLVGSGFSEWEVMAGRFFMGFLVLLPFLSWQKSLSSFTLTNYATIVLMIAVAALLGMFFYYKGLKQVSARVAALGELFFPLCAVTVNWVFLKQSLDFIQIIGAILLIISSFVVQYKKY